MREIAYMILVLLMVLGCKPSTTNYQNQGKPVARVFDEVLFENEVLESIPDDATPEDSLSIRNAYIHSWINQKLLLRQAEQNLPEQTKDVSKKLEKYRQDLLIYSYQNQLLIEKLDTNVSDKEIETYYKEHEDMFKLADYIVKVRYVQLDSTSFKHQKIRRWMMSDGEEELAELEDFCSMHSTNYHLKDNWIYLDELLKQVPIVTINKEKLLKNKNLIELHDNGYIYLVRIVDYKFKNGISPLSLERENIKRIILNNRKFEFLNKLSEDIYQKAKKEQQIEIYVH